MNKHYNQLGKILLGETKKTKKTKKTREPQAPVIPVPPGTTTTPKEHGQQAMADDEDHPAHRKSVNSWTTYKRIGSILGENGNGKGNGKGNGNGNGNGNGESEYVEIPPEDHFTPAKKEAGRKRGAATTAGAKAWRERHGTPPILSMEKGTGNGNGNGNGKPKKSTTT